MVPGGPKLEDCDLAYSIMETPFQRDIVKEICDAAHQYGIKIDLYFSHTDWYDAHFRPYGSHPVISWRALFHPFKYACVPISPGVKRIKVPHPTPQEVERMMLRHRQQLLELMTNYGPDRYVPFRYYLGPRLLALFERHHAQTP